MTDGPASIWHDVVGQDNAISQLRAAAVHGPVQTYLFVGLPVDEVAGRASVRGAGDVGGRRPGTA